MPVSSSPPLPPHHLDLVIDFANTVDLETGLDQLDSAGAVTAWLTERGLLDPAGPTVPGNARSDLDDALQLREALRSAMMAHNGLSADPSAAASLNAAARRGRFALQFDADGSSGWAPQADGVPGALASLLVPVVTSQADGSWQRVKACRAVDCHWSFYDHSRNRSGIWCDMAVCGNRTKVRAYRRRKPDAEPR